MRKIGTVAGVTLFILCISSGRTLLPGPDATEIAESDRDSAARRDREARSLSQEAQAHIDAGRFNAASFILPQHVSDTEALARYLPPSKRGAIRAVAGISLWPRPQDGKVVDRHTLPYELFSFLPGFFKTIEAPLTERERRLMAFGQLQVPAPRQVYDAAALAAWFRRELGVDARERQFLYSEKVDLPASSYDVDREQWNLKDSATLVPARIGTIRLRFGGFGVTGTTLALIPVNLQEIASKLGQPVIPMRFDDARCAEMTAFYRFFPVTHEVEAEGREARPGEPGPPATMTIAVHVSEVHLYCAADKKLLWSQTF